MFCPGPGRTVHCIYMFSLPKTLVRNLAKNLVKNLAKNLGGNLLVHVREQGPERSSGNGSGKKNKK